MNGGKAVSVHGDMRAIQRDLNEIQRKLVPSVAASCLTTIARDARRDGVKTVSKETKIPAAALNKRTKVDRASPKKLRAGVWVGLRNWNPLYHYPVSLKQNRRGESAGKFQLRVGPHRYDRAFIQETKHGSPVILQRQGKERYPIDLRVIEVRTSAVATFSSLMGAKAAARWRPLCEHRLELAFRRRGIATRSDLFLPTPEVG